MPPKIDTDEALAALANQDVDGPLDERLEAAIDRTTKDALDALTAELGGKGMKSKAVRQLLRKGAKAELASRRRRA